jgi:hypothetical protein
MRFIPKVQDQFKKSGWFEGRNVKEKFVGKQGFDTFPMIVKEFLYEYGGLIVEDCKPYSSDVTTRLNIGLDFFTPESIANTLSYIYPFNKNLFTVGYFNPDHYMIKCDTEGKIYMVGDDYFLISDSFQTGIEKLLMDDWSEVLLWDANNKKWIANNER